MVIALLILLALAIVAIVSTVACLARDGYRRVPTLPPGSRLPLDG